MSPPYDFIIIGGGTSGPLLANRLAHTSQSPRILLLEAGTAPTGSYLTAPYHRYTAKALRPDLDHGYVSEKEAALGRREIAYARGKALGGCSAVNFGVWLWGSEGDYVRWGDGDGEEEGGDWKWENVQRCFTQIENLQLTGSEKAYAHLADPAPDMHGHEGRLSVGLPPVLERGVVEQMEALAQTGKQKINLDPNSGDPTGISIFPASYGKEGRVTSAMAHLADAPRNLEVWTGARVDRLVWDEGGKRVVGVRTEDGRGATAKNEVIICAGAIDTPKLLLLNGIGPKVELEAVGIDVKVDLPGVGKNLHDHVLAYMSVEVDGCVNDKYAFESTPQLIDDAERNWSTSQTGAFTLHNSTCWGGFLKIPELETYPEYAALPPETQSFLAKDIVPAYEFIANSPFLPPGTQIGKGNTYVSFIAILMNAQSTGTVTLRSKDAAEKPVIKLNYLAHPYDARVFREAIRRTWTAITTSTAVAPHIVRTILGPESMSDEDVDAFAREGAGTVWHAGGTCKMGREGDEGAVVDKRFRVRGVKGLRVVDLSVAPFATCNHTQSTAYLIAQVASERLIGEYGLDGVD